MSPLYCGIAVFATGVVVTSVLIPVAVRFALHSGLIDFPSSRRIHQSPIPRAGGAALFAGFHAACIVLFLIVSRADSFRASWLSWWLTFLLGSSFVVAFGLIDDLRELRPWYKLSAQVIAASMMFLGGVRFHELLGTELPLAADLMLTAIWFILITNAFNLIDGIDGLATGLAAIGSLGIAGSFVFRGLIFESYVMVGFIGACIGFLRFNRFPARVFLGDCGSNFIGFFLAAITISTGSKGSALTAMWIPLLALSIPIFDTFLAIWRRSAQRCVSYFSAETSSVGIMKGDLDHLHHRLLGLGITPQNVTTSLWLANATMVLAGLLLLSIPEHATAILSTTLIIACIVVARYVPLVELTHSGSALRNLSNPSRRLAALITFAMLDILGLCISLFAAMRLTHDESPLVLLAHTWLSACPKWCGAPLAAVLFAEIVSMRKSLQPFARVKLLSISLAIGMGLNTWRSVQSSVESPEVIQLQALIFFGLAYTFIVSVRILPVLLDTGIIPVRSHRRADTVAADEVDDTIG